MDSFEDSIKSLTTDKKTGEVTGFRLNGLSGYFDFSKPEYRDAQWDAPIVGGIYRVGVSPRDPATDGTRRFWVKRLERLDEDTFVGADADGDPGPDPFIEGGPTDHTRATEAVQRVRDGEHYREDSIAKQVALKCAADVVVAMLAQGDVHYSEVDVAQSIDLFIQRFRAGLE